MKIKTKSLSAITKQALLLVSARTSLPILSHMHLSAKAGRITAWVTDLDAHEQVSTECDGDLAPCCVPAKMFTNLVQAGNGEVDMELDKGVLRVKSGWSSRIPCLAAEEFPPLPSEKLKGIGASCADLAEGIEGVEWAGLESNQNDPRYVLRGVFVQIAPKLMTVVATNGKCACLFERALIGAKFSGVIPLAHAEAFALALRQPEAVLEASENWVGVKHQGGSFYCRMIEGNFPLAQLKGFFPEADPIADLDRDKLIEHVKNCDILDNLKDDVLHGGKTTLEFSRGKVTISGQSRAGAGYSAEIEGRSGEFKAQFGNKLLIPALEACTSDKIGWRQVDELSPASWVYGDFKSVIMGMRLK